MFVLLVSCTKNRTKTNKQKQNNVARYLQVSIMLRVYEHWRQFSKSLVLLCGLHLISFLHSYFISSALQNIQYKKNRKIKFRLYLMLFSVRIFSIFFSTWDEEISGISVANKIFHVKPLTSSKTWFNSCISNKALMTLGCITC